MARGLYYNSFAGGRSKVWYSGFIMLVLMMGTAFFGYVLPWSQMSYWAATVITTFVSVMPIVGDPLLVFLWGGISVDQATLTRIYGFHFILPFVILAMVIVHLALLHRYGSGNPMGIVTRGNTGFGFSYVTKDFLGIWIAVFLFIVVVFFHPNLFTHPDHYVQANPAVTPTHIVPEWYFLPFYGILRSIPSKAGGLFVLIAALLAIFFIPVFNKPLVKSDSYRPFFVRVYWFFVMDCFLLGWAGANPVAYPYTIICQIATVFFFLIIFLLIPLANHFDTKNYFDMPGSDFNRTAAVVGKTSRPSVPAWWLADVRQHLRKEKRRNRSNDHK
jgi:ubiquinol-cytochrome c reductase cytochrome b subunit